MRPDPSKEETNRCNTSTQKIYLKNRRLLNVYSAVYLLHVPTSCANFMSNFMSQLHVLLHVLLLPNFMPNFVHLLNASTFCILNKSHISSHLFLCPCSAFYCEIICSSHTNRVRLLYKRTFPHTTRLPHAHIE